METVKQLLVISQIAYQRSFLQWQKCCDKCVGAGEYIHILFFIVTKTEGTERVLVINVLIYCHMETNQTALILNLLDPLSPVQVFESIWTQFCDSFHFVLPFSW